MTEHAGTTAAEQEDRLLRVIARMDGTPFPTTARLPGRWVRGRLPTATDWTRGIPFLHKKVRESAEPENTCDGR